MPANSNINKKKGQVSGIIILIVILDFLFMSLMKYKNQGLSISDYNISATGNILNLLFIILLIAGLIIYTLSNKVQDQSKLLIFFTVIMTLLLILTEIYSFNKLPLPKYYFFDHPLKDVLKGILLIIYQIIQFVFISVVWVSIFERKSFIIFRAIVNSAIIVVLLLTFSFVHILGKKGEDINALKRSRILYTGVVLGSAVWTDNKPSPSLAARTLKASELYKEGILDEIQLTGGNAPGELSEAEVADNYLKSLHVNSDHIWVEKKTSSTTEQIKFIKNELITKKDIKNILIISDAYHLTRIKEICSFYKVKAKVAASDLKSGFDSEMYHKIRESIALLIFWFFAL